MGCAEDAGVPSEDRGERPFGRPRRTPLRKTAALCQPSPSRSKLVLHETFDVRRRYGGTAFDGGVAVYWLLSRMAARSQIVGDEGGMGFEE